MEGGVKETGYTWRQLERLAQDLSAWRSYVGGPCPPERATKALIDLIDWLIDWLSHQHSVSSGSFLTPPTVIALATKISGPSGVPVTFFSHRTVMVLLHADARLMNESSNVNSKVLAPSTTFMYISLSHNFTEISSNFLLYKEVFRLGMFLYSRLFCILTHTQCTRIVELKQIL